MNSVLGWVGKDSLLGFGSKDVNGGNSGAPGTRSVVSKKCGHVPTAATHSCPVGRRQLEGAREGSLNTQSRPRFPDDQV